MNELLKQTTWTQYLIGVSVLTAIYYLIVLLLYFRKDIVNKLKGISGGQQFLTDDLDNENIPDSTSGELMEDLEKTVQDIGHSILVPGNKATKDELLVQLKTTVANFGGLSRPGYRYALNNYIIEKARENCGADFSEEELEDAWESLSR